MRFLGKESYGRYLATNDKILYQLMSGGNKVIPILKVVYYVFIGSVTVILENPRGSSRPTLQLSDIDLESFILLPSYCDFVLAVSKLVGQVELLFGSQVQ
jgi:hypothetical protein